jgi:hypothetical protein
MVNQYEVSSLGADEKAAGEAICFVEQKRMKAQVDLRVYTDDLKTTELFRIKARQRPPPASPAQPPARPDRSLKQRAANAG